VAEALAHAHGQGILHPDIKPSNLLLDIGGNVWVTDFGLAKSNDAEALTEAGDIAGTVRYMAPERFRGDSSARSDVYGLGVTLYELLTLRPAFDEGERAHLIDQILHDDPLSPRSLDPKIPRDLETICLKCLGKQPDERYASAAALAADLRRFLTGEPIAARPVTRLERVAKWARRKPTLAAAYLLGLLTALLGGLGGAALWQWRAAERARGAAELARGAAVTARDGERKAREQLAAVEYGRTIQMAHQHWRENDVPAALALLDSTRADLRGWEWRYVHRLCHSDLLTLEGHTDRVYSASFSADGSRVVTGSQEKTAKVWDARLFKP
jgi:hypothetical protein